jgi:hypothetical protein
MGNQSFGDLGQSHQQSFIILPALTKSPIGASSGLEQVLRTILRSTPKKPFMFSGNAVRIGTMQA